MTGREGQVRRFQWISGSWQCCLELNPGGDISWNAVKVGGSWQPRGEHDDREAEMCINFHCKGIETYAKKHIFVRLQNTTNVWLLRPSETYGSKNIVTLIETTPPDSTPPSTASASSEYSFVAV